jgi:hypothetical protein
MINVKSLLVSAALFAVSGHALALKAGDGLCPPRQFTIFGPSLVIDYVEAKTKKPDFSATKTSDTTFVVQNTCNEIRFGGVALRVVDRKNPVAYVHYIVFSGNANRPQIFESMNDTAIRIKEFKRINENEYQIIYENDRGLS